jgi:hypothetical protein
VSADLAQMIEVFLVVDAQGGLDAHAENASTERARCPSGDAPVEEELDAVGAAEVQVFPDDFLEELATGGSSRPGAPGRLSCCHGGRGGSSGPRGRFGAGAGSR